MFRPLPIRGPGSYRRGFTIVELLVVIVIIGVLTAILIPAVMAARAAARRIHCLNNMRQVGLALNEWSASMGRYPGHNNRAMVHTDDTDADEAASWVAMILPQLGRQDLYELARENASHFSAIKFHRELGQLPILVCPSDPAALVDLPVTSLVVNCGVDDEPMLGKPRDYVPDTPANGVFHAMGIQDQVFPIARRAMWVTVDYISRHDGSSNTFMLSENLDADFWVRHDEISHGFTWWHSKQQREVYGINEKGGERPGRKSHGYDASRRPITGYNSDMRFARPSSFHNGGVNAAFCDGHGQFLREDIPYWVYVQLMTPNGKKAMIDVYNKVPAPVEFKQSLSDSHYQ
jgi:prepilin-type N-terminal cleavage/methylation domain-containing protein/prepilin-type processing-associated H-X9-DG protein